jgi:hypothetical protein
MRRGDSRARPQGVRALIAAARAHLGRAAPPNGGGARRPKWYKKAGATPKGKGRV